MKQDYLLLKTLPIAETNNLYNSNGEIRNIFQLGFLKYYFIKGIYCLLENMYNDYRDLYEHSVNTAINSIFIALTNNFPVKVCIELGNAALLHDVGKLEVPKKILYKPTPLNSDEWQIMKRHPEYGNLLLSPFPLSSMVFDITHYHHCGYNFQGYPKIEKPNNENWQFVQIITLADAYEAMTSNRVYRKALPYSVILSEIKGNLGKQFEPYLGTILLNSLNNLQTVSKGAFVV